METHHYYLNKSMQKKTTQNFKIGSAASLFFDFKANDQDLVKNLRKVAPLLAAVALKDVLI